MSSKASLHVWTHSRQQGGPLLVLLALADHADDSGQCSLSVSILARMARVSERHCKRILAGLTASGELIRTRRGGGAKPGGYRLNPVAPSHDAGPGPVGTPHMSSDIRAFSDNSAGGVTPMSPEGWHGGHREGDTGVTRGVTALPPYPSLTPPPSGEGTDGGLSEKPVSGKAGIRAELGFAAMENLKAVAVSLSSFTPAEIRSLWNEWRACRAGPATLGPSVGGAVPGPPEPPLSL